MNSFKNNNWFLIVVIIALTGFTLSSCKKNITDPPPMGAPDIVANISIHDIKTRYSSGTPVEITDDAVIEGVVSCDDKSGNYYQQIAIQDATGGVLLRIAGNNHYLDYPVGRKIYVKLKGLYLGQYNGTLQFGGGIDQAYASAGGVTLLAANLQDQHIVKGPLNQPLVPQVVNVSQLTTDIQDKYVSTLIKLVGYEFDGSDLGKNYADDGFSGNRTISSCSNPATNHITLRTSNYCNFATIGLPQGNGDIIGIYSFFGSTKQLTIRDTSDVQFYGPRCPSPSGGGMLSLTSSPLTLNFDALSSSGLPAGVYVKHNATSSALGIEGSIYNGDFNTGTAWNQFSAGFKNYASATGLPSTASSGTQNASTNRALGVRQTSSTGDPGSAFAFLMPNTTGKTNLKLEFKLQSLDASPGSGRTTVWKVDYGFGNNPSSFTTVTTSPASLSTVFGSFSNTTVNVDFGSALNNISQPVWVRIVTLDNTTGGGNRPSTAVDDVKFSWN